MAPDSPIVNMCIQYCKPSAQKYKNKEEEREKRKKKLDAGLLSKMEARTSIKFPCVLACFPYSFFCMIIHENPEGKRSIREKARGGGDKMNQPKHRSPNIEITTAHFRVFTPGIAANDL